MDDLDPLPAKPAPGSGHYQADQNRSGLLVVLDDDDDAPSDRIDHQTAAIKRGTGTTVRPGFNEPSTGATRKPGQVDLPDLPDLPGKF
jgi:hypothetical protein